MARKQTERMNLRMTPEEKKMIFERVIQAGCPSINRFVVQSFSPKDNISPEQAHSIGMQFVKEFFPKHEVLVATHLDNGQDLMKTCGSRKEFIHRLREKGYDVRWEPQQKTMTYTCPNGMKVRDNKLHDARFLKEAMQREFRIREQYLEQIARFAKEDSGGTQRDTVPADSLCDTQGSLGADAFAAWAADRVSGYALMHLVSC